MSDSLFAAGQVHRFRSHVAAYVRPETGKGATVYMTPDEARTMAATLVACPDDCDARGFADSQFRTVEIAPGAAPPADPRVIYRIVRMYSSGKAPAPRAGLMTITEAQAHCRDPETSSATCRKAANVRHTANYGRWFDAFEVHPRFKGQA